MKNKVRKSLLWVITLITGYFIISTLYFGYSNINEQKGIYTFYWSGIDAFFRKEKDFGFATDKIVKTELNGADGPYVYSKECYRIDEDGLLRKTIIAKNETLLIETNHPELKGFYVNLRTFHNNEEQIYETPEKLLAISDIEGNFDGFYSFLLANGVIDKNCNWSYGNGHLVLNGDFVDRGKQVTQVLWLIYKLDEQAQDAGGKVHYILGNHEIMMLQGNVSYANFKYIEAAKRISEKSYWDDAMRFLYSEQSELGKWLRTKNIIERIGTTIFVHAGLNIDHAAEKITIQEFNQIARNFYGLTPTSPYANAKERLTLSSISSPYWDRRLAMDLKNKILFLANRIQVKETTLPELDAILNFYQASQIVIGHSIVKDIHTDYAGKIIKIDIKHGEVFKSGTTKGILIENKTAYKVDDLAKKSKL